MRKGAFKAAGVVVVAMFMQWLSQPPASVAPAVTAARMP